jgi:exopolysaccharide production protein ExoQ
MTSTIPDRRRVRARDHQTTTTEIPRLSGPLGFAAVIFVAGICTLELLNPPGPIKPWNLVMVCSAALASVIALIARARSRSAAEAPRLFFVDVAFVAYLSYCALTAAWSALPLDTLVQVIYLGVAWIATVLLRTVSPTQVVRVIMIVGFTIVVLSLAMVVVSPSQAFQPAWDLFPELRGVFQHQQRLGLFLGMLLGLLAIAIWNRERAIILRMSNFHRRVLVLTLVFAFLWAFARLNMLFVAIALTIAIAVGVSAAGRALAGVIAVGIVGWIVFDSNSLLTVIGGEGGTLTGRTTVWERTQAAIDSGSGLGYGFASFTAPEFDQFWGDYRAPSAHNSILQANFETGFPGLAMVVVLIVAQVVAAVKVGRVTKRVSYSLFLVVLSILSSLTGVTYAGKPTILLLLTLFLVGSELQAAHADSHRHTFLARRAHGNLGSATRLTEVSGSPDRTGPTRMHRGSTGDRGSRR